MMSDCLSTDEVHAVSHPLSLSPTTTNMVPVEKQQYLYSRKTRETEIKRRSSACHLKCKRKHLSSVAAGRERARARRKGEK